MKYLTENDLRIAYRDIPFEVFTIHSDERLTPGARTFLSDRKVKIIDNNQSRKGSWTCNGGSRGQPKDSSLSNQVEDLELLAIRCEILSAAQALSNVDLPITEELTLIERYLADGFGSENLSSSRFFEEDEIESNLLIGQLSNVGLFIKTQKGEILLKLYPLYFSLLAFIQRNKCSDETRLAKTLSRLGNLISYYLGKEER